VQCRGLITVLSTGIEFSHASWHTDEMAVAICTHKQNLRPGIIFAAWRAVGGNLWMVL
jgi:hypothetical protein